MTSKQNKITFESAKMGEKLDPIKHTFTQDDVNRFATGVMDYHPIHVNQDWSEKHKVFGERTVVHGMFTLSFMCSVITNWAAQDGGFIHELDVKYVKGVFPGDEITCNAAVIEKHYIGNNEDYLVLKVDSVNQDGDRVATGKMNVQFWNAGN